MNTVNRNILAKINSLATKGKYIILSEDEISECVDGEIDDGGILKACKELAGGGYVDLKYAGGGMFCLAPLKDIEPEEPQREITEVNEREPTVIKTGTAAAFFAALFGGAVGSIIASLLLAVINAF